MVIVKQSYEFMQSHLLPSIAKRHKKLFLFGFEALTLRPFVSLKMYRLMDQEKMLAYFPTFVVSLELVTKTDTINVGFSTFGEPVPKSSNPKSLKAES